MVAAETTSPSEVGPVGRYVEAHRRFATNGGASDPEWLLQLRAAAIARFESLGFPTTRQEEWRFTNVAPIVETPFTLSQSPGRLPALAELEPFLLGDAAPHRLVFVNGRFAPALSRMDGFPSGVRVESLAAMRRREPELVQRHVGSVAAFDDHPFRALNTAFLDDGALVHVPARVTLAEPVQILYVAVPGSTPAAAHPRTLIVVEREASAAVVETYAGLGAGAYWTNAVTEIVAGDGARVDYHRVQRETEQGFHVASTHCRQGRDSRLTVHPVAFGAALARHDLRVALDGTGAYGILNGLYLLRGRQHVDHHTVIDHRQPHGESHEYFNGVLDGASRSVFTGRIIVRPGAQRTDSKQTNNNVLLSTDAHADSQPQLEIYADDVKCTHGSTTGPLDERHLFYIKTRGLDTTEARRLLTYGFAAEIIGRMEIAPLRERLDRIVKARVWGG
jgi:Fe-S cluster assembly protein SufD